MMAVSDPTFEIERGLFARGAEVVIGCDEVGRGAIAGPVVVGAVVVDATCAAFPDGLRDSKMLSDKRRHALVEPTRAWSTSWAVAAVDNRAIDERGIVACLREAAVEAIVKAMTSIVSRRVAVILDGTTDWLSVGLSSRLDAYVHLQAKADRDSAAVAAASVLAKVHRDDYMAQISGDYPGYGWEQNRGYGSRAHYDAIDQLGASSLHRLTWLRQGTVAAGEQIE